MNKKIGTGIIAGTGFYDTDIITDKEFLEIPLTFKKPGLPLALNSTLEPSEIIFII